MLTFLMSALLKFAHTERVPHGAIPAAVVMTGGGQGAEGAHGGAGGPRAQPHIAPPLFKGHCYVAYFHTGTTECLLQSDARFSFSGNFENLYGTTTL